MITIMQSGKPPVKVDLKSGTVREVAEAAWGEYPGWQEVYVSKNGVKSVGTKDTVLSDGDYAVFLTPTQC